MRNFNMNTPRNNYNGGNADKIEASHKFKELRFNQVWIKTGATIEMVDFAQKAGKYMADNGLTSSKIRSIYGEVKRIQMKQFTEERTAFYLLKPKVAYAVGREKATNKNNMEGLKLFQLIFNECFPHVTDNKTYKNFCDLMEAILAYHKSYVTNDK